MDNVNESIFNQAIRTADILYKMFGNNCEVVVHNFSNLEASLIYVAGTLTKRKIGSPATDLVLKEYKKPISEIKDIPNYMTSTDNGLIMKSSTVFLHNNKKEVIGALCINFNISFLSQVSKNIQSFIACEESEKRTENFHSSIHDVIEGMIKEVIQEFNKPTNLLEMEEKIDFVRKLEEKGTFLIKGATEYVATVLGVSKFTIYNYLQKIRSQNEFYMNEGNG